ASAAEPGIAGSRRGPQRRRLAHDESPAAGAGAAPRGEERTGVRRRTRRDRRAGVVPRSVPRPRLPQESRLMSATTIIFSKPPGSSGDLEAVPSPRSAADLEALRRPAGFGSIPERVGRILARRPSVSIAVATLMICTLSWISAFLLQFDLDVPASAASFM